MGSRNGFSFGERRGKSPLGGSPIGPYGIAKDRWTHIVLLLALHYFFIQPLTPYGETDHFGMRQAPECLDPGHIYVRLRKLL